MRHFSRRRFLALVSSVTAALALVPATAQAKAPRVLHVVTGYYRDNRIDWLPDQSEKLLATGYRLIRFDTIQDGGVVVRDYALV